MAKPKTRNVEGPKIPEREVLYPEIKIWKMLDDKAMTAKESKKILGWMTEDEYVKDKLGDGEIEPAKRGEVLNAGGSRIKDYLNNKIICTNNVGNRPYNEHWAWELTYTILNRRWRFNGEPMQIGKTGRTLSAQHRLIALIMACQVWENDEKGKSRWHKLWPEEPTIETLVVVGIEEDSETTRTIDNGRKRSLSDVIYADTGVFASLSPKERKNAAKVLQHSILMMWQRTGAKDNAFAPYSSHSECLDFLARHDHLKNAVKHIMEENKGKEKSIGHHITPGHAAAILYLMGASSTDPTKYRKSESPNERTINFDLWDKAEEFWVAFAQDASFHDLRNVLNRTDGSLLQKGCVLAKAWNCFLEDKRPTESRIKLKTDTNDDGVVSLLEWPDFRGIDRGPPRERKETTENTEQDEPMEPDAPVESAEEVDPPITEEEVVEVEVRKVEARKAKENGEQYKPTKDKKSTGKKSTPKKVKKEEPVLEEVIEEEEPSESTLEKYLEEYLGGVDELEEVRDDADDIPLTR